MPRIIDEMPSLNEIEHADVYEIVRWHLYLRPTMSNEELPVVKAIAQRYDQMSPSIRENCTIRARREHGL